MTKQINKDSRTEEDYDKAALFDSLWAKLKNKCSEERFNEIIDDLKKRAGKSSRSAMFDELNRNRSTHKYHLTPSTLKKELGKLITQPDGSKKPLVDISEDSWQDEAKLNDFRKESDSNDGDEQYRHWYKIDRVNKHNPLRHMEWVEKLYWRYNVSPKLFPMKPEDKKQIERQKQYIIDLKLLDDERKVAKDDWKNRYVNVFEPFIKKAIDRIYVYDYTENFKQKNQILESYYRAHAELFELIEKQIKEQTSLKYSRIIALPLRTEITPDNQLVFENNLKENPLDRFFSLCSIPLFVHICRCLHYKMVDKNKKFILDDMIKCGFYVLNKASRTHQFSVLDNAVSYEMYRYNLSRQCLPDNLSIQELDADHESLQMDLMEFEKMMDANKQIKDSSGKKSIADKLDQLIPITNLRSVKSILEKLVLRNPPKHALIEKKLSILNECLKGRVPEYYDYMS